MIKTCVLLQFVKFNKYKIQNYILRMRLFVWFGCVVLIVSVTSIVQYNDGTKLLGNIFLSASKYDKRMKQPVHGYTYS